jgi:uncharacterized protein (TIGR02678 family)
MSDVLERRDAACALMTRPIITDRSDPATLAAVRRHSQYLQTNFASLLGYRLVVETTFARLLKTPLAPPSPVRPAHRSSGREYTPITYTYLALVTAALLAPGTGEQILISDLVAQVRADAATAGIPFSDTIRDSRDLVAALHQLTDWGVLAETDGTVTGWTERQEEALLSINRALLPHLLARPLPDTATPADVWTTTDPDEQPRRSLRRKIAEDPVTSRDDLTPAERDVLSRERTQITAQLGDLFGLVLEVRAEGLLAYAPDGGMTDIDFPGPGTRKQAALLLINALTDLGRPTPTTTADIDGRSVPGLHTDWATVDDTLTDLTSRYRRAWGAVADDTTALRADIVALLESLALATATPTGLVVHPAAGRYQPETAPQQPSRARRRLAAATDTPLPLDTEPTDDDPLTDDEGPDA